jgi:hypothetical protein
MITLTGQSSGDSVAPREAAQRCLTELGLTAADQAALARQGFISREVRGRRMAVYKLRFRVDGRQRVHFLGTEAGRVRRIEEALRVLQDDRRLERTLGRLHREVAVLLRKSKRRLAASLAAAGYRFHGRAIRRPRPPARKKPKR